MTIYKHPESQWEYNLVSLCCFSNLWYQMKFGKERIPTSMNNLSPMDYATKYQSEYPEMHIILMNLIQYKKNEIKSPIKI
jgi:hypothetical protein